MEWEPSEKMTVDDLKAVLMSWRIEIPKKPSKEMLQKLVAKEFKKIMQRLYGYAPIVTSVRRVASSSCAASDKSVGTDMPAVVTSYIGSEAGSDHGSVIVDNTMFTKLIINDLADLPNKRTAIDHDTPACAAVAEPEATQSAACAAVAEPEATQSAACAATVEHVPSLRRAVEMEVYATAKAKMAKDKKDAKMAKDKKDAKEKKASDKGGVFIDADQKKDGDKNPGDISA